MRPVLKPALRRVWRDMTTLQLGVDPRHRVVLTDVCGAAETVLALLDGTRDSAGVVATAAALGVPAADAERILALLASAGVLEDAAARVVPLTSTQRDALQPELAELTLRSAPGAANSTLARRRTAAVLVAGCGRLGTGIATLLAGAGVGRLLLRDEHLSTPWDLLPGCPPAGDGVPRAVVAAAAVRAVPGADVDSEVRAADAADCAAADVAVVVADRHAAVPRSQRELLQRTGTVWLAVGLRDTCGVVGPLVLPGRTACPLCLDLTRTDRDPGWAAVAAQLASDAPRASDAAGAALTAVVAGLAAGQLLDQLDGAMPASVGATLETYVPDWTTRRRAWPAHPRCECGAPATLPEPDADSGRLAS